MSVEWECKNEIGEIDTDCLSTCSVKNVSDHGCEVTSDIQKGNEGEDWAYVKCPDPHALPPGVKTGWKGTYDTVKLRRGSGNKSRCTKSFNLPSTLGGRRWMEFSECKHPDRSNAVRLLMAGIKTSGSILKKFIGKFFKGVGVGSLKVLYDAFKNAASKLSGDARQVAKRIFGESKKEIEQLVSLGEITAAEGERILKTFQSDYEALDGGQMNVDDWFEKQLTNYVGVIRNLQKLNPNIPVPSVDLLDFALKNFPTNELFEIVSGGHVVITDGGEAYQKFQKLQGTFQRGSSHYDWGKYNKQFGKTDTLFGTTYHLLGGIDDDGHSWFQFENAPWDKSNLSMKAMLENYQHVLDFLAYASTLKSKNIGPEGASKYTEKWNRLIFDPTKPLPSKYVPTFSSNYNITAPNIPNSTTIAQTIAPVFQIPAQYLV